MRGRSPVTVWRPPARAHTLAHTQSKCRVDGSAARALRAVQRRVGTSHCVLQDPFRLNSVRIVRVYCATRTRCRPPAGARARARGRIHTTPARAGTALRAASAAAPPDATNLWTCAVFFARFPGPRSRFQPTDVRDRRRDRPPRPPSRLATRKRKTRAARRAPPSGSPAAPARSPGSGVSVFDALGSPTGVSLSPSRFTTGDHEQ